MGTSLETGTESFKSFTWQVFADIFCDVVPFLCPICIKIGYVSFMYGSTMWCRMPVIDPVYSILIHLATGTFHTTQLKRV
jgi:hypothetical protein